MCPLRGISEEKQGKHLSHEVRYQLENYVRGWVANRETRALPEEASIVVRSNPDIVNVTS